jgi:hypothetical protein
VFLKSWKVGMHEMPHAPAVSSFSSTSTFKKTQASRSYSPAPFMSSHPAAARTQEGTHRMSVSALGGVKMQRGEGQGRRKRAWPTSIAMDSTVGAIR